MKQLPFNIVASLFLLGAVFFVANQRLSNVDASTAQMPGIMVDGIKDSHLQLHGFGFRPGSLVTLELQQRDGGHVVTGVNVWVDATGSFAAAFDMALLAPPLASLDGASTFAWDDWIVVARASTGSVSIPLKPGVMQ